MVDNYHPGRNEPPLNPFFPEYPIMYRVPQKVVEMLLDYHLRACDFVNASKRGILRPFFKGEIKHTPVWNHGNPNYEADSSKFYRLGVEFRPHIALFVPWQDQSGLEAQIQLCARNPHPQMAKFIGNALSRGLKFYGDLRKWDFS